MQTEQKKPFNPARYLPGAFSDIRMGEHAWGLRDRPWFNSLIMLFFLCLMVGFFYEFIWLIYRHNRPFPAEMWGLIFVPMVIFYLFSFSHGVVIDSRGRTVHVWVDYHFFIRWRSLPLDDLTAIELTDDWDMNRRIVRTSPPARFFVTMVFPDEWINVFRGRKEVVETMAKKLKTFVEAPVNNAPNLTVDIKDKSTRVTPTDRIIAYIMILLVIAILYLVMDK